MKATLLRTQKLKSKYGGDFYYFFFKGEDGKSYRSSITPQFKGRPIGNFTRWIPFIGREGVLIDGLVLKGNMIDADSVPKEIR